MLVLTACLLPACTEPAPVAPSDDTEARKTLETSLRQAGLQVYWERRLDLEPGERVERLLVLDETLYARTSRQNLLALDAAVGNPKWSANIADAPTSIFGPTHVNQMSLTRQTASANDVLDGVDGSDLVTFDASIVSTHNRVMVIDRRSGRLYRDIQTSFVMTNRGACNGQFFFPAESNRLYVGLQLMAGVSTWKADFGQMVLAPNALWGRRLYVAGLDGLLRCAAADQFGDKLWELTLPGPVRKPMHVNDQGLFVPCDDGKLYGLNPERGGRLWDPVLLDGLPAAAMQVAGQTAYLLVEGRGLLAIDLGRGRIKWTLPQGRTVLSVMEGMAYVVDTARNLLIVEEESGRIQPHTVALHHYRHFAPNLWAPALYAVSPGGGVACIRKREAGHLTVEQLIRP